MDKSTNIIQALATLIHRDGDLRTKDSVLPYVDGTDIPDATQTSFVVYTDDGRWYEVSVQKVHEPDEEELEAIAHSKSFRMHNRWGG